MSNSRHEILNRLKNAVHDMPDKPDFESRIYHDIEKPLKMAFKESLEALNGRVYLAENEDELYSELKNVLTDYNPANICCAEESIQNRLKKFGIRFSECAKITEDIEVGITDCEFLIAHTGSVMVSSAQKGGRRIFAAPSLHIVIASEKQIVDYLDKAYTGIQKKYKNNLPSQITLITGPSRTADIEKTLIIGAHGPRQVVVFVLK